VSAAAVTLRTSSPPATPAGRRLVWLDALRGFAALFVVFDHLSYYVLQHVRADVYQYFDPGSYGVFVFFLVSGYIVPASLERRGSVRGFWVSRLFRLYPLYLVALAVAVVLWKVHLGLIANTNTDVQTSLLTHGLMLSNVLGTQNAINVIWTLSYEMAFYLLVTALFVTGKHQRSSRWALLFAIAAVALGGVLPMTAISRTFLGTQLVAELADLLIVAGVALAVTRTRLPKRIGALLAGGTALVLVCLNGNWVHPFEALTIMALMFTGTMLYRAERGDYPWRRAIPIAVAVFVLAILAGRWNVSTWNLWSAVLHQAAYRQWVTAVGGAGLTFAVGLACRTKKVPAVFAWLGLVSFSVYLVHPLMVEVFRRLKITQGPHPFPEQLLMVGVFLAILLALCWLTHRFVESPMQRQGRRVAGWLETWFGPDTLPAVPASPSATPSHAAASSQAAAPSHAATASHEPVSPRPTTPSHKAIAPHMSLSRHEPPPSRESSETAAA
jgi:peptidoglycan/LPS O-acetylase OafA/YrhL